MMKVGDLVLSRNGEWGWLERVAPPASEPVAWVRMPFGNLQTFSLHGLRRPDPERDWEIFAHIEEHLANNNLRLAAE